MTRQTQRPREEQTELAEPIRIGFRGRLRDRIAGRLMDQTLDYNPDGEDTFGDDVEENLKSQYRAFRRAKTKVVIETVEEAACVHSGLAHYATPGITWMNGIQVKAARRVRREIVDEMRERGYEPVYSSAEHGSPFLLGFEEAS